MTKLEYVDNTTTVSSEYNTYIVNASGSITYTLPSITADEMSFIFSRIDNTNNIVTIITNTNTISQFASIFTTSMILPTLITVELISFQNVWYALFKSDIISSGSTFFTTGYISNTGSPGITFSVNNIILYFPYPGTSSGIIINNISLNTTNAGSINTYKLEYGSVPVTVASFSSAASVANRSFTYPLTNTDKALLPVNPTVMYIVIASGNNIRINSIVIG